VPTRIQNPWIRRLAILAVIVLVVVVVLLLVHLAFMGSAHHEGVGCATCSTVLLAAAVTALGALVWGWGSPAARGPNWVVPLQPLAAIATGRHPPPRGVVLRI
jgi:hypothetical protein